MSMQQQLQPIPVNNSQQPRSSADAALMEEAQIPVDLRLIDVAFPVIEPLNRIISIAHRYQWSTPQHALNADYNQVASDLANLSALTLIFSELESQVGLACNNMN